MKIQNVFGSLLFVLVFSACEMETEELVDVNKKVENHDSQEGGELTQEEIEDLDFQEEYNKAMEEAQLEEDSALVDELINLEDRKKTGEAARGSCDAIAEASTCLEYYGSFWTATQVEFNCSDSGIFSLKPCPEGSLGGCNIGNGGPTDMVTWFYNTGGSPMGDSIQYATKACNMNPLGRWINAK